MADAPIGTLVTLDKVYELLYLGNLLPTETTREVDEMPSVSREFRWRKRSPKPSRCWSRSKICRAPRTTWRSVLHPTVDAQPLIKEVEAALKELETSQFVRLTEEGYKLLTVQEMWTIPADQIAIETMPHVGPRGFRRGIWRESEHDALGFSSGGK